MQEEFHEAAQNYISVCAYTWVIVDGGLGPYLVVIIFSSTTRILLKLPHGKPLFTLCMLRRTRDTKLL